MVALLVRQADLRGQIQKQEEQNSHFEFGFTETFEKQHLKLFISQTFCHASFTIIAWDQIHRGSSWSLTSTFTKINCEKINLLGESQPLLKHGQS